MLGFVETEGFFLDGGAEQVHLLHQEEEAAEHRADPCGDDEDADDLRAEKFAITTVEDASRLVAVACSAKDFGDILLLGHETDP